MIESEKMAIMFKNRVCLAEMAPAAGPWAPSIIYTIVDIEFTATILKLI